MLCRVRVYGVSPEDLLTIKSYYFFALEKPEEHGEYITLNAMGGEPCSGTNDFGESCRECRYQPEIVRKYLRRQKTFEIEKGE